MLFRYAMSRRLLLFQTQMKTGVLTSLFPGSKPSIDCIDSSSKAYQDVLAAGLENYTQLNCFLVLYQNFLPGCTILNMKGYNSSEKKGLTYSSSSSFCSLMSS